MQLWQPSIPDRYLSMPADERAASISARRAELGDDLIILGHHYQVDSVIRHADYTGDSLKLSQLAAEQVQRQGAKYIIFCGVHFMAESADLLAPDGTAVILPDLSAGCSMADMADYEDACDAWDVLSESLAATPRPSGKRARLIPVTYVNSTAAVKAFVGMRGGACCTSSNADLIFEWAMNGGDTPLGDDEEPVILFLPDQHLGRNTAAMFGLDTASQTAVYDPKLAHRGETLGGMRSDQLASARVVLWAGHCSVHKLFRPEHCDQTKADDPQTTILVHPECSKEVVDKADLAGSTEYIIRQIENAEPGTSWAVGTEHNLVHRLSNAAAERGVRVRILSDCQCLCTTMYRIDEPHLLWVLDNLAGGKVINQVSVHPEAKKWALTALDRMLAQVRTPGELHGIGKATAAAV
jgi:quinolinate synthase